MLIMSNFDQKPFDYYTPREYSRSESTQPPRSMSFTESLPMSSTPASPDAQGGIQQAAVGRSLAHNNYSMAGVTATFPGPPDGHQYRALQASRFPSSSSFTERRQERNAAADNRLHASNESEGGGSAGRSPTPSPIVTDMAIAAQPQMQAQGQGSAQFDISRFAGFPSSAFYSDSSFNTTASPQMGQCTPFSAHPCSPDTRATSFSTQRSEPPMSHNVFVNQPLSARPAGPMNVQKHAARWIPYPQRPPPIRSQTLPTLDENIGTETQTVPPGIPQGCEFPPNLVRTIPPSYDGTSPMNENVDAMMLFAHQSIPQEFQPTQAFVQPNPPSFESMLSMSSMPPNLGMNPPGSASGLPRDLHFQWPEDSYSCICGAKFRDEKKKSAKGNLKRHLEEQINRERWQCPHCPHRTARLGNLNEHMKNRHGIDPPASTRGRRNQ